MAIGSYAVEKDYSHYVAYASKTIFAVVGTATKGPVGEAVVCTSTQDLVNKFGSLKEGFYALYAGQYFLSQSSKLYFVRAASNSVAAATVSVAGTNASSNTIETALGISFIEKGTFGNGFTLTIASGTESNTYDITVKNANGSTIETITGVGIDELVVGYTGKYIKVTSKDETTASLTPATLTFADGNDGTANITSADYINAAQALAADIIDMNLFAVPGVSDAAVITAMLSLAESRGDCLYLVDPPKGLDRDGIIAWHNGGDSYEHAAFNSSYGALYYDWVTIYDSVNKVQTQIPPSVPVAASYAYSDRTSDLWYAPAGLSRGIVRGVLDSNTKLSKSDVTHLYEDGNNINSIYDDPQVGLVLWGQKTLLRETTALNRVNVRRLLNYLKRVITAACNYLTFEPNDRITWNSFEMKVIPLLDSIKTRRGIYDYRVIKGETIITDEDIDNYRMPCMVLVRPTKAAEDIPIYFVITSTGADFNEVLEANGVISLEDD